MTYRGIFEYEYPTEHKPPVSIDVNLHGDCVRGKIIEWEYRPQEQESKPMVEIDLDYVIKQKYIERKVLDKIRAEIIKLKVKDVMSYVTRERRLAFEWTKYDILKIINKYKAESEPQESEG